MKEEKSNRAESRGQGPASDFLGLGALAGPGVEAAMRAGNTWLKGIGSLNEEMLSFSQEQIGKCMEAGQSLLKCSTLDQAINAQQSIARGTLESYYREANKLLDLTSDIARRTLVEAGGEAAAAGED